MSDDENPTPSTTAQLDGRAILEAEAKARLDNMARLRALRLAHEASQPKQEKSVTVRKKKVATGTAGRTKTVTVKKEVQKTQALSDWLETQVSVGRRT